MLFHSEGGGSLQRPTTLMREETRTDRWTKNDKTSTACFFSSPETTTGSPISLKHMHANKSPWKPRPTPPVSLSVVFEAPLKRILHLYLNLRAEKYAWNVRGYRKCTGPCVCVRPARRDSEVHVWWCVKRSSFCFIFHYKYLNILISIYIYLRSHIVEENTFLNNLN